VDLLRGGSEVRVHGPQGQLRVHNNNAGVQTFNQDSQTYFTSARVDASLTQKIRVYSSWLYQLQRESGAVLPIGDSTAGLFNRVLRSRCSDLNTGTVSWLRTRRERGRRFCADAKLIATTRFGYFFENYHDFVFRTPARFFLADSRHDGRRLGRNSG